MLQHLANRIKPKDWKNQNFHYKQVKLDGHRLSLVKEKGKPLVGYGRTVKPDFEISAKYPHIVEYDWWKTFAESLPDDSILDGEVYVIGGTSSHVTNQLTIPGGNLSYGVFGIQAWEGEFLPYGVLEHAERLLLRTTSERLVPWYYSGKDIDTREQLLEDAKMLCIEGWVLKEFNYSSWYKLKPVKTLDVIVTGFTEGKGKFLGATGALKVSCWVDGVFVEIARVSGMDDQTRWDIDEDKDLGRVCEVQYQAIGEKGRLVFPRFIQWREDKPKDQCRYSSKEI